MEQIAGLNLYDAQLGQSSHLERRIFPVLHLFLSLSVRVKPAVVASWPRVVVVVVPQNLMRLLCPCCIMPNWKCLLAVRIIPSCNFQLILESLPLYNLAYVKGNAKAQIHETSIWPNTEGGFAWLWIDGRR